MSKPFTSAHDMVEKAIVNGVFNKAPGTVQRVTAGAPHDMSKPWRGRELTWYKANVSLWTKTIRINLGWVGADGAKYPEFTVTLAPPMTEEEMNMSAETYMMALNVRRVD